jgi:hypothetical protein
MTQPGREDLAKTLERLDALLGETKDPERLRMGMGVRLALGMAQEIRLGRPLGSDTADMVAAWTDEFGEDAVNRAVQVAREFLTRPDELKKALGERLGLGGGAGPGPIDLEAGGRGDTEAGRGDTEAGRGDAEVGGGEAD